MAFDWTTFALQALNFVILVWLLQRFLYRPVLAVIAARRAAAATALDRAEEAKRGADRTRSEFEARTADVEASRHAVLEAAYAEADRERAHVVEEAREAARAITEAAKSVVERERRQALAEIRTETVSLAVDLARKLLADTTSMAVAEAFLARALEELAAAPAETMDRLRAQLAAAPGRKLVVACAPLPEAATQETLRTRLRAALASEAPIEVVADDRLIAGIDLRFPETSMRYAWADTLARAEERLGADNGT